MHEYDNNGEIVNYELGGIKLNKNKVMLLRREFAKRYTIPKLATLITGGVGYIENPHMLESYYTLTKEINITNFK